MESVPQAWGSARFTIIGPGQPASCRTVKARGDHRCVPAAHCTSLAATVLYTLNVVLADVDPYAAGTPPTVWATWSMITRTTRGA